MHAAPTRRPQSPQATTISFGLWQNFGGECTSETQREIIRRAFDRGSTHFDLANNYGPPWGRRSRTSAVSLQPAWPEIATN